MSIFSFYGFVSIIFMDVQSQIIDGSIKLIHVEKDYSCGSFATFLAYNDVIYVLIKDF